MFSTVVKGPLETLSEKLLGTMIKEVVMDQKQLLSQMNLSTVNTPTCWLPMIIILRTMEMIFLSVAQHFLFKIIFR